tara:strand:+ start:234 stop:413 length:180 start_codon:yes stop_codon:yes gene_type:complete
LGLALTTFKEVIETIRRWKLEASNHNNDGWVMHSYKEKLQKVRDELNLVAHNNKKEERK